MVQLCKNEMIGDFDMTSKRKSKKTTTSKTSKAVSSKRRGVVAAYTDVPEHEIIPRPGSLLYRSGGMVPTVKLYKRAAESIS